jgi:hypothetical protein
MMRILEALPDRFETGEDTQSNFRFRAARAKFSSADFAGPEAM